MARLRAEGFDAYGVATDLRHLNEVVHLADEAFRLLGHVDVVFSNAGVVVAGPIAQMTHDDWRWVIDIDLWGSIHAVEVFIPRLLEQGAGGHLAFTASFAGLVPNAGLGTYGVAKYDVVALAETLSREVKDNGIGVSVLCPMVVETKLVANSERIRGARYGLSSTRDITGALGPPPAQDDSLSIDDVARLTADAILANRLYILPHQASVRRSAAGSSALTAHSTTRPSAGGVISRRSVPHGKCWRRKMLGYGHKRSTVSGSSSSSNSGQSSPS